MVLHQKLLVAVSESRSAAAEPRPWWRSTSARQMAIPWTWPEMSGATCSPKANHSSAADSSPRHPWIAPAVATEAAIAARGCWPAAAHSTRNYGHATTLVIDGDTGGGMDAHAYVKVKVGDTTGLIDRAALRLWVTDKSRDGPTVAPSTTSWAPNSKIGRASCRERVL